MILFAVANLHIEIYFSKSKLYPSYHILILSPTAEKCSFYTGIGLRRPQATMIVEGMYARRRVLSLVPSHEVCVCKWGGAPCTHSTFIEIAPGLVHIAGPMEESEIGEGAYEKS